MSKQDKIPFTEAEIKFIKKVKSRSELAGARYPLVTGLIATFGFVLMLDGFNKFIEKIDFLSDQPLILFVTGFLILAITGKIYQKLN